MTMKDVESMEENITDILVRKWGEKGGDGHKKREQLIGGKGVSGRGIKREQGIRILAEYCGNVRGN